MEAPPSDSSFCLSAHLSAMWREEAQDQRRQIRDKLNLRRLRKQEQANSVVERVASQVLPRRDVCAQVDRHIAMIDRNSGCPVACFVSAHLHDTALVEEKVQRRLIREKVEARRLRTLQTFEIRTTNGVNGTAPVDTCSDRRSGASVQMCNDLTACDSAWQKTSRAMALLHKTWLDEDQIQRRQLADKAEARRRRRQLAGSINTHLKLQDVSSLALEKHPACEPEGVDADVCSSFVNQESSCSSRMVPQQAQGGGTSAMLSQPRLAGEDTGRPEPVAPQVARPNPSPFSVSESSGLFGRGWGGMREPFHIGKDIVSTFIFDTAVDTLIATTRCNLPPLPSKEFPPKPHAGSTTHSVSASAMSFDLGKSSRRKPRKSASVSAMNLHLRINASIPGEVPLNSMVGAPPRGLSAHPSPNTRSSRSRSPLERAKKLGPKLQQNGSLLIHAQPRGSIAWSLARSRSSPQLIAGY